MEGGALRRWAEHAHGFSKGSRSSPLHLLAVVDQAVRKRSPRWRGRHRQHARRVRYPIVHTAAINYRLSAVRNHGRGCGVGRSRGIGAGRGVGLGRTVAVGVAVAVAVGLGLGVAVGVGVGVTPPPWPGAWISTVIGSPVLKKPTVALAV